MQGSLGLVRGDVWGAGTQAGRRLGRAMQSLSLEPLLGAGLPLSPLKQNTVTV